MPINEKIKNEIYEELEKINLYKSLKYNFVRKIIKKKGLKKSELIDLIERQLKACFLEELLGYQCFCDFRKQKDSSEKAKEVLKFIKRSSNIFKQLHTDDVKSISKKESFCESRKEAMSRSNYQEVSGISNSMIQNVNTG